MHGWTAAITDDAARVRLGGGSVSIDLGLSAAITSYILDGGSAPGVPEETSE